MFRAWLEGSWRPVLASREIRRGKNKGKFEVAYRSSATRTRKTIIRQESLKPITTDSTKL